MLRFRYSWRAGGQTYHGELRADGEEQLRAHLQRIGGELLEVSAVEPVEEPPASSAPNPEAPSPASFAEDETRRVQRELERELTPPISQPAWPHEGSAIVEKASGGDPHPAQRLRAKLFVFIVIFLLVLVYCSWMLMRAGGRPQDVVL